MKTLKLWVCGLHLGALYTIALVQPLFDLLGKNATFFVARDSTPGDVLIFAFGWALGPPLVAFAVVALVRAVSVKASMLLHYALCTFLVGVFVLQAVKGISDDAKVVLPLAYLPAAGIVYAYSRTEGLQTFVSILGVAPVVVLGLFLVGSRVREIVFPPAPPPAAAGAPATNPVPVVVMIFDELPATSLMEKGGRTIDAKRFPNFAELAESSTWYRNASTVADGTYVAVPAILTGDRPEEELPTNRSYPDNIYKLLGKRYEHHNAEPMTVLCTVSLCGRQFIEPQGRRLRTMFSDLSIVERRLLLPTGMASKLPPIDQDWENFRADADNDNLTKYARTPARVDRDNPKEPIRIEGEDLPIQRLELGRDVVKTMKPGGDKPGFWMVHYVEPHVPWRFLPDGRQYVVAGPSIPGVDDQDWGEDEFLLDQAYQRHFLQARFADRLLGDALDEMKDSGLWDEALVIVAADHGVSIRPNQSRRPITDDNFGDIASVPLFVKKPGQAKGAVDEELVTTLDIVPTIVSELGLDTDQEFDGLPVDQPRETEKITIRNGRAGELLSATPEAFLRSRDAVLADRLERIPEDEFDVGPRLDLVGRPITDLDVVDAGDSSLFLNNARLYRRVKRKSGVLPVYLTGSTRNVEAGTDLVVAIDGRIAASGEAYDLGESHRFSLLVRPSAISGGGNDVRIYAVEGSEARQLYGKS